MNAEHAPKRGRGRPRKHFQTSVDLSTVESEVADERALATQQLAQLAAFEPQSQDDLSLCAGLLADVRARADALEQKRLTVAKPLTDAKRALDALFKPVAEVLDSMDSMLSEKVLSLCARVRTAQAKALEAVEAGERDPETLALARTTLGIPEGFSEQVTWDVEVEDIEQVPLELLQLNEKLVKAYVRERKGDVAIPGLRVVARSSLRRTTGGTP